MRVLLLHNPTAGRADHSQEELTKILVHGGCDVLYRDIKASGFELSEAAEVDFIAIAGGDGTVGKVLRTFADVDRPFAIIPLGTANNVARSLKLPRGAEEMVAYIGAARERRLDVGLVRGPWGLRLFFEAVGIGALAQMVQTGKRAEFDREEKQRFMREGPQRFVREAPPQDWRVRADGQELPGGMILAEVLNMPITGPNLPLGPADCFSDGLLSLAVLRPEGRDSFAAWLAGSRDCPAAGIERMTAKRVELVWSGGALRIDDDLPEAPAEPVKVEIQLAPQKLRMLVPR